MAFLGEAQVTHIATTQSAYHLSPRRLEVLGSGFEPRVAYCLNTMNYVHPAPSQPIMKEPGRGRERLLLKRREPCGGSCFTGRNRRTNIPDSRCSEHLPFGAHTENNHRGYNHDEVCGRGSWLLLLASRNLGRLCHHLPPSDVTLKQDENQQFRAQEQSRWGPTHVSLPKSE